MSSSSAGKGDDPRPFSFKAWDEGYARIDFSGRKSLKDYSPQKPEAMEYKELLPDEQREELVRWLDISREALLRSLGPPHGSGVQTGLVDDDRIFDTDPRQASTGMLVAAASALAGWCVALAGWCVEKGIDMKQSVVDGFIADLAAPEDPAWCSDQPFVAAPFERSPADPAVHFVLDADASQDARLLHASAPGGMTVHRLTKGYPSAPCDVGVVVPDKLTRWEVKERVIVRREARKLAKRQRKNQRKGCPPPEGAVKIATEPALSNGWPVELWIRMTPSETYPNAHLIYLVKGGLVKRWFAARGWPGEELHCGGHPLRWKAIAQLSEHGYLYERWRYYPRQMEIERRRIELTARRIRLLQEQMDYQMRTTGSCTLECDHREVKVMGSDHVYLVGGNLTVNGVPEGMSIELESRSEDGPRG